MREEHDTTSKLAFIIPRHPHSFSVVFQSDSPVAISTFDFIVLTWVVVYDALGFPIFCTSLLFLLAYLMSCHVIMIFMLLSLLLSRPSVDTPLASCVYLGNETTHTHNTQPSANCVAPI